MSVTSSQSGYDPRQVMPDARKMLRPAARALKVFPDVETTDGLSDNSRVPLGIAPRAKPTSTSPTVPVRTEMLRAGAADWIPEQSVKVWVTPAMRTRTLGSPHLTPPPETGA